MRLTRWVEFPILAALMKLSHASGWYVMAAPEGLTESRTSTCAAAEETSTHVPLPTLRLAFRQLAASTSTSIDDIMNDLIL